jgi:hypothetical protein
MRIRRRTRTAIFVAALSILALPAGGLAYGYWHSSGTGTGSGTTATTVALTLSAGTPSAALYPGGNAGVALTATNTNPAIIHINTLSLNTAQGTGGFSVDAGHSGCSVSALSFTAQSNGGSGWNVPARVGATNGTLAVTLSNALSMAASAADACQGATFTVYLAAS